MSLRNWVASAFPNSVANIVDDCLLQDQQEEPSSSGSSSTTIDISSSSSSISYGSRGRDARHSGVGGESREGEEQRLRCLVAVLELGLICSSESLKDRPDMAEVAAKLMKIRDCLGKMSKDYVARHDHVHPYGNALWQP